MPSDTALHALPERLQRHDLPFGGGHATWRCLGEGPPLVLLHGGHGSWAHWVRNIELRSQRFRVCVVDLPGYGDSSAPAAPTLESLLAASCRQAQTEAQAGAGHWVQYEAASKINPLLVD